MIVIPQFTKWLVLIAMRLSTTKNLLGKMNTSQKYENPSPEIEANIFSKLFFCWLFPFLKHAYGNDVQTKDIYSTRKENMAGSLGDLLEKHWDIEIKEANKRKGVPSLLKVLINTFGLSYMKFGLWLLFEVVILRISLPQLLREFLKFFRATDKEVKVETAWILGVTILLINFLANLIFQQYFVHSQVIGMRVRIACSSLLYRKVLKLSYASLSQITSGEIINLLSNDLQRLEKAAVYFNYFYTVPLQFIVASYIMYNIVGISCIPSLVFVMIEGLVVQGYFSKVVAKLRSKITVLMGGRLAVMNDIISGIHVIKMYAWEKPFEALVEKARKLELAAFTKLSYTKGVTVGMVVFTERFCLFLTIIIYILMGNQLSGDIVFSVVQLLNIVQASVCFYLPLSFESYADIKLAVSRFQEFLLMDEKIQTTITKTMTISKDDCIELRDVRAGWLSASLTLTDISLNVKPGTLCCILGKVGAGKTSFLHLLLRELSVKSGEVDVAGKISYASQEPWLFVASMRNNILFGQHFLNDKYQDVVRVCALNKDFQQFTYRDLTMVGERGVSLSGGQRARINLARAVYLDADIYLLDDPLSAVDTHVAKHLFEECIIKYLRDKTRILVTHQLQFLKEADLIVILEDGKICKIMANDEVCENSLIQVVPVGDRSHEETCPTPKLSHKKMSITSHSSTSAYEEELDTDEEMMSNDVSLSSYIKYFSSGSNIWFLVFTFAFFLFTQVTGNMTDLWIMYWSNKNEQSYKSSVSYSSTESDIYLLPEYGFRIDLENLTRLINISSVYYQTQSDFKNTERSTDQYFYLYVYSALALGSIVLSMVRPMIFCKVCLNASKALHRNMLASILEAPMGFFQTNPSGRILNRFSKDVESIDDALHQALLWTFQIYLVVVGILIMTCVVNPWMLIGLSVTTVVCYYIMALFLPTLLKILKLEANNRSPIFSHISATVSGLATIRASKMEEMVKKYFDLLQDIHTSTRYMVIVCIRSFCFYLEVAVNLLLAAVTCQYLIFMNENSGTGNIGLVLSHTTILIGILQYFVIMTTDVISTTVSVERVFQYINIDREGPEVSVDDDVSEKHWPHSGGITFTNVCLAYVPNDPPVLKNLNISIRPGEKVGIVGRTGAGKSSLITCLFRLAPTEGRITIDDVDILKIDLKTLRSNISIIPQEPVLFSATLRYNLDPLGEASDEALWKVLENVKLKDVIENLDLKVNSRGSNFSVGQRQLICLARAIFRNNKILVMDEATANIDPNTDAVIQKTIRENFSTCTVLTIAHRLNTIMDSDRVLVMSSGQVVEFDHPHVLLQKSNGYFLQMVQETGKAVEATLRNAAREDYERKFFMNRT